MSAAEIDMEHADDEAPPEGAFVIATEEDATYWVDRLISAEARIERLDRQHKILRARAAKELESLSALVLPELEHWAKAHPPRKGKTLHLLTGSMSFRSVNGGPRVTDKAACLAWARRHLPEAIVTVTTEKLDAETIKAHVEIFGEIPPGCEVVEPRETFSVKAPKEVQS